MESPRARLNNPWTRRFFHDNVTLLRRGRVYISGWETLALGSISIQRFARFLRWWLGNIICHLRPCRSQLNPVPLSGDVLSTLSVSPAGLCLGAIIGNFAFVHSAPAHCFRGLTMLRQIGCLGVTKNPLDRGQFDTIALAI
jgi:hypothetical protein